MLGSLNFDKLTNDIKQGLYEVIVSSNNGMITEKLDETILNPIKTLQINILKKTDNSKILP
jgi:histidinol phosphatase-like enzyme